MVDLNGTRAAIRAGYAEAGASAQASRLLANRKIQERISAAKARRTKKVEITAERVLAEWFGIADLDPIDAMHVDPVTGKITVKNFAEMHPSVRRAIAKINQRVTERKTKDGDTVVETVRTTIEFHPKTVALKALGDHLGLDAARRIEIENVNADAFRHLLSLLKRELPAELFTLVLQAALRAKGLGGPGDDARTALALPESAAS